MAAQQSGRIPTIESPDLGEKSTRMLSDAINRTLALEPDVRATAAALRELLNTDSQSNGSVGNWTRGGGEMSQLGESIRTMAL